MHARLHSAGGRVDLDHTLVYRMGTDAMRFEESGELAQVSAITRQPVESPDHDARHFIGLD